MRATAKLSSKSQLTVPSWARRKLGIGPGSRVALRVEDNHLVLERVEAGLAMLRGKLRDVYGDPESYLKKLRAEWDRRS